MTPELRRQIFELRAQNLGPKAIARTLSISEGSVRYQLDRPPKPGPSEPGSAGEPVLGSPAGLSSEAVSARSRLEVERAETARLEVQLRRLELENRMKVLERSAGGDGNGLTLMVLEELRRLREPAARPPATPSLVDQLAQVQKVAETVSAMAPSRPSGAAGLEFEVATARLRREERESQQRLEWEREERSLKLNADTRRSDVLASVIEQWGPVIGAAAAKWLEDHPRQPAPPDLNVIQGGQAPQLPAPAQPPPAISGPCPKCGATLGIDDPAQPGSCPQCGQALVVRGERIVARGPATVGAQTISG